MPMKGPMGSEVGDTHLKPSGHIHPGWHAIIRRGAPRSNKYVSRLIANRLCYAHYRTHRTCLPRTHVREHAHIAHTHARTCLPSQYTTMHKNTQCKTSKQMYAASQCIERRLKGSLIGRVLAALRVCI